MPAPRTPTKPARLEQPSVTQHIQTAVRRHRILRARRFGYAAGDSARQVELGRILEQFQIADRRGQYAQRRLQRIDVGNRDRNRRPGQRILDKHHRQDPLARIEIEIQRLDVGMRVHVEIERRLRHADFYLRAEISDVGARRRAGFDIENVTDFVSHLAQILKIGALMRGNRPVGSGKSIKIDGIAMGRMPNMAYLAQITITRAWIRHRRIEEAAPIEHGHHSRQVVAGDVDPAGRAVLPGIDFDVGHHAIEQRLRRAVDGDDHHYAQRDLAERERRGRPGGDQKNIVERRSAVILRLIETRCWSPPHESLRRFRARP